MGSDPHSRDDREGKGRRLKKLLCSFYLKSHPNSVFGPTAESESPFTHICLGARNGLRVCEHRSITFAELQDATDTAQEPKAIDLCGRLEMMYAVVER